MSRSNGWGFESPKPRKSHDSTEEQSPRYSYSYDDDDEHDEFEDDDEFLSDQEMPHQRRRSASYGDAEDILLNTGYYESFSMEEQQASTSSTSPNKSTLPVPGDDIHTMTKGLHHRNNTGMHNRGGGGGSHPQNQKGPQTPRQSNLGYEFYRTPTPKRKPLHPGYHHHHGTWQLSYWRRPKLLKFCLALGFGAYLVLLVKSSVWLLKSSSSGGSGDGAGTHHHRLGGGGAAENVYGKTGPDWIQDWTGPHFGGGASSTSSWSQDLVVMRRMSRVEMEQRALKRRERTRPKRSLSSSSSSSSSYGYAIQRMDHRPPPPTTQAHLQRPFSSLASMDQLCGFVAQNDSLEQPNHYPAETALNGNSARVLITGILNPVGFPLAMYLHHRCGVEVIGGLDLMYPNTVENRLQLVHDRMALLHTNIPKLVKPIGLSFVGVDPKTHNGRNTQGGEDDFLDWKPTHVVHLASYSPDVYSDASVDPTWRNSQSPYVRDNGGGYLSSAPFFALRSSMVAMEQLLQRLNQVPPDERPHFVYASVAPSTASSPLQAASKLVDEVLARTYSFPSIAIRLPSTIYGPWGQPGSVVHDLMEAAATKWGTNSTTSSLSSLQAPAKNSETTTTTGSPLDLLHVDDAVEAIVAAMQYQTPHAIAVDLTSAAPTTTVQDVATNLESMAPGSSNGLAPLVKASRQLDTTEYASRRALWKWEPRVGLQQGLLYTMAWHLHRHAPYGPARVETADGFLKRHGQPTCAASDWGCHKGKHYVPCLSECNTRDQCLPSVFDEIRSLVFNVTEGCDIVLYTQSMGYNVQDLELHAEYMDDADLGSKDKLICNFAFVPRESDLVATVTSKVPNEQLAKFGIKPQVTDSGNDMKERKLNGLNGRLLYRGWILLWVRDAVEELSVPDKSLLKLSPGKLFAPDVGRAIFMEENFSVSPDIDDVSFLVGEMNRKPFPKRTLKKDVHMKDQLGKETVKRKKFRLPPEPRRRAAILFAPLRIPNDPRDSTVKRYKNREKKLNVHDAAKFMVYELGTDVADREATRRQRDFYEKIPSYINRNGEMRSFEEPWYRYSMRHWVRTRWVVHDMHLEESRLLRCDWYQEHLAWGTELDQLSFAHVMAVRELKRRIAHNEPDDHVKTFIEQHPHLKELTDSYEWYPMETDANQLYREPVHWMSALPDHFMGEEEQPVAEETEETDPKEPTPLFVRIMSERVMAASRKVWAKARKQNKKKKK